MDDPQRFSSFQHFNEDTNNVNIFNCEFCEQTFNQQFDLQNHIFYNHEQELQNLKNSLNNDYPPSPEEEVNYFSSNPQKNGVADDDGLSSIIRSSFELSSQDFDSYNSHTSSSHAGIEQNSEKNVKKGSRISEMSTLTEKNNVESGGGGTMAAKTSSGKSDFFGNLIDNTVTHQNHGDVGVEPSNDAKNNLERPEEVNKQLMTGSQLDKTGYIDEDLTDDEMDDDSEFFDDDEDGEYMDDETNPQNLKIRPIQSLQTAMNEVQEKFSEPESSPENVPETESFEAIEEPVAAKKQKLTANIADNNSILSNSVPTYCNFKKDFFGEEGNVYSIEIKGPNHLLL